MKNEATPSAKARVKVKTSPADEIKTTRTRTMPAGEFKAHCLAVIDEVHNRREQVIITKYGKPMARLMPLEKAEKKPESVFGFMKGKIHILGDIVEPITEPQYWDADIFPPDTGSNSR
ncbi:MAG: type II toxin-antitoxin system Phd/YefM family antitoxin [Silvibacterium sp.]|nr:type II toxin-antitoxin system Phd/YefM family antitoxin [Silvibacterium sp.]MBV8437665.1 type II toxin-antitoxin system Phd/YefM family antitoxin [Silvibacterium sp.]